MLIQFNKLRFGEEVDKKLKCNIGAGYIRFKDGFQESFPVEDYLDLFDLAAHKIQEGISGNSSRHHSALQLITGEHMWKYLYVCTYLQSVCLHSLWIYE